MKKALILLAVFAGLFCINSCSLFEEVIEPVEIRWGIVEGDDIPTPGNLNIYLLSAYDLFNAFDSACKAEENYISVSSCSCYLNGVNKKDVKKTIKRITTSAEQNIPSDFKLNSLFAYRTFRCEYKFGDGTWEKAFERTY